MGLRAAALLSVEEGAMYRELRALMRRCQQGVADVGAAKLASAMDENEPEARDC
jgi:hypothetical protein